jgi:L-malate glycosyltransferase
VVATNVGGNAEAVEDGISGFIVPVDDPVALSAAVIRLISNPSQAKAMGEAGRNLVMEKFTTEAMMSKIAACYKDLLASGGGSPRSETAKVG